ncbi:hypothetical protein RUND412_009502 [Rhizina undulata]
MADADEAAKAEKIAAAKKRYEKLKKAKGKTKSVNSGTGVEDSKPGTPEPAREDEKEPEKEDAVVPVETPKTEPEPSPPVETAEATPAPPPATIQEEQTSTPPVSSATAAHSRTASIHARRSSASGFRRPSISAAELRSNNKSPLSPNETLPDIYRKQAGTISELTETVEKLEGELAGLKEKEKKLEEALLKREEAEEVLTGVRTELRETVGRLKAVEETRKESEVDGEKLRNEVATLTRQTSHLNSLIAQKDQTISDLRLTSTQTAADTHTESLSAKESQIETMSMELSKLLGELSRTKERLSTVQSSLSSTQALLKSSEEATESLTARLDESQKALAAATELSTTESKAREAAEKQVETLKAELEKTVENVKARENTIAKDHASLKIIYKDLDTKSQATQKSLSAREAENAALKSRLETVEVENRRLKEQAEKEKPEHSDDLDELEDAERRRLRERVRTLESLLFEERKKSGEKASHEQPVFSEVPLGGGAGGQAFGARTWQDEEEERRRREMERLERIREIKRGLEEWRGWRLDLTTVGGSGVSYGAMFDV